ncbi:uncharacterized protein LOC122369427 [Amphibalanus amphitrite]|uniref:uncharacterized protein LOC122369427 n=1 Tax=Amphibalanus amphitrite TaxID=1232801 RepID=UPI001C9045D1|nr:uncharacterized protein LOC122369427 [Amphibalanus amphitrite]XP_043200100.1 uncharacterized protein LOC122369427 [Amphibalanus amphitrite]
MGARRRLCCCALLLAVLAGQLLLMARLRGHRAPDDHTAASLGRLHGGLRQLVSAPESSPSSDTAPRSSPGSDTAPGSAPSGDTAPDSAPSDIHNSTPESALSTSESSIFEPISSAGVSSAPELVPDSDENSASELASHRENSAPMSASNSDQNPVSGNNQTPNAASKSTPSDGRAPKSVQGDTPAPKVAPASPPVAAAPLASASPTEVMNRSPPHLIIILSSSPRSGSSLLGEILSTSPNTAYFFEPFYYHVKNNISVSRLPGEEVQQTLRQLLTCQLNRTAVLREAKYRRFIWRPPVKLRGVTPSADTLGRRCAAASTRVVKLVRPRLRQLLPLLHDAELGPHLRLVHLVRDPRGTLNSQLHATTVWNRLGEKLTTYCDGVRADLAAARPLHDARYQRVHYEQLALRPEQVAVQLYRGMQLPQPPMLHAYFQRHMNSSGPPPPPRPLVVRSRSSGKAGWRGPQPPADRRAELASRHTVLSRGKRAVPAKRPPKQQPARPKEQQLQEQLRQRNQQLLQLRRSRDREQKQQYFSTYRGPDFDPYHWRKELKPELIHELEHYCADVIAELETEVPAAPERDAAGPAR